jgi:serine phosphatase RsbU (regulator of sigma subunit)
MAALHILKGANEGTLIPLDGDKFVLGRDPDCTIVIPMTSVSRKHAQILRIQGRYSIEDLKSTNGTYVNNQVIAVRTLLKHNDHIRICDFLAAFFVADPDELTGERHSKELVEALASGRDEVGRQVLWVLPKLGCSLEEECQRIRDGLQRNHIFYDKADSNGLHQAMLDPLSQARRILAAGFHRLVVLDAWQGVGSDETFDLERFLRYVYGQLVQTFDLHLSSDTYHLENIAQVLKDEPRSLFCFLNVQYVPVPDLHRLRGFTQELHQVLFLYCGSRNREEEDEEPDREPQDSEPTNVGVSLEMQPAEKLRDLLEISANLSKTLDLDALMPKIVESLFQLFRQADRCFVIQAEEGSNRLLPRVVKTRRPQDETNARPSTIVRRCLGSGQAFLSDESSRDDPIRSVMCVPLCTPEGKAFGVIQLDTQDRSKKFTQEDLKLLWGVANQAAIAMENARMHEEAVVRERFKRDLELAKRVQHSFLPSSLPQVPGYDFVACLNHAYEGGSDSYSFIPLSQGRWAILLGDAAGKGVDSALLMVRLLAAAQFCFPEEKDPARAIGKLNDWLNELAGRIDRFVALAAAVLDPVNHTVTLVSAGHPAPLLRRSDGVLEDPMPKDTAGLPLGISEGCAYQSCQINLRAGDTLLLFSSGIPAALDIRNKAFGMMGVRRAFQGGGVASPSALGERFLQAVLEHAGELDLQTDIAFVCFGRTL